MKKGISKEILGVRVDFGLSTTGVWDIIENDLLKDGKSHYICTTNPEFVMEAQKNEEFRSIINSADLSVPDGTGVLFANYYLENVKKFKNDKFFPLKAFLYGSWMGVSSLFKGNEMGAKVTGVELTYKMCEESDKKGYSIFFLGGWPKDWRGSMSMKKSSLDIATRAAEEMRRKYPNVNIIGSTSQFSSKAEDDEVTLSYVRKCMDNHNIESLDFLVVAYGHPNQENWIVRNADKIPAKVSMGVGSVLDYVAGEKKLAPHSMIRKNLEWLFKLITQPWRYKRIFMVFPSFPLKIYIHSINR